MTKVRYVGPADQVSLPPEAGGITFRHGESVEIDNDLARSLLEQGTFVKAEPSTPEGRGSAAKTNPDVEVR